MKKNLVLQTSLALAMTFSLFFLNLSAVFSQATTPNELLIRFRSNITDGAIANYKNSIGAIELAVSPLSNIRQWAIPSFSTAYSNYGWSNINEVVNGSVVKAEVNSADFNHQTTLPHFDLGPAPSTSMDPTAICPEFSIFCGTHQNVVKVAILDTGIGYTGTSSNPTFCNPALFDPYYGSYIGYDYVNDDADPVDDQGHGTHIAGIIAQMATMSIDLPLQLMSFKTHNNQGNGNIFDVILATDMAVLQGADIINMSFSYPAAGPASKPSPLKIAIDLAGQQGVLVVAAAGNVGNSGSPGTPLFYPAAFDSDNIISVASVNCDRELSTFSAWGIPQVDIGMLGESISGPHYLSGNMVLKSGTSQASAIVSGIAAQLASNMIDIHYAPLKCSILSGAEYSANLDGLILTEGVANAPEARAFLVNGCGASTDWNLQGAFPTTPVQDASADVLSVFPNPFSKELSLSLLTTQAGEVTFTLFNALGGAVYAEKREVDHPGAVSFSWTSDRFLAPGIYFVQVRIAGQCFTKKVVKD